MNFGSWETPGNELPSFHEKWLYSFMCSRESPSSSTLLLLKGTRSRFFELFWPRTKLPKLPKTIKREQGWLRMEENKNSPIFCERERRSIF